jgi:hypothetical protein
VSCATACGRPSSGSRPRSRRSGPAATNCQSRGLSNCRNRRTSPPTTSTHVQTSRRSSRLRAAQLSPEMPRLSASSALDCVSDPLNVHSRQHPPEPQLTPWWVAATPRGRGGASDAGGTELSSSANHATGAVKRTMASPSSSATTAATVFQRTRALYGWRLSSALRAHPVKTLPGPHGPGSVPPLVRVSGGPGGPA